MTLSITIWKDENDTYSGNIGLKSVSKISKEAIKQEIDTALENYFKTEIPKEKEESQDTTKGKEIKERLLDFIEKGILEMESKRAIAKDMHDKVSIVG